MLERLRSLFTEKSNHKADSIHTAIFQIYCNLPQEPRQYKDGPSWAKVKEEDLSVMSEMDKGFLLALENGKGEFWLLAHTAGNESWIGLSTPNRRVRYCLEDENLIAHYESFENGAWDEKVSEPIEDIDFINPIVALANRYAFSRSGTGTSQEDSLPRLVI